MPKGITTNNEIKVLDANFAFESSSLSIISKNEKTRLQLLIEIESLKSELLAMQTSLDFAALQILEAQNENQVYKEKLKIASTDKVTGCLTYNIITEKQKKDLVPKSFYMAFIDINNLKFVNDNFGHFEGNVLLKHVTDNIKKFGTTLKYTSNNAGDEFIVFFDNKEKSDEFMHSAQSQEGLLLGKSKTIFLAPCFAFGVVKKEIGETIDCAINRADHAMYEDKAKNKKPANCCCVKNKRLGIV